MISGNGIYLSFVKSHGIVLYDIARLILGFDPVYRQSSSLPGSRGFYFPSLSPGAIQSLLSFNRLGAWALYNWLPW